MSLIIRAGQKMEVPHNQRIKEERKERRKRGENYYVAPSGRVTTKLKSSIAASAYGATNKTLRA